MTPLHVPADGWTVDDMPDFETRCELVDGALLVTPPEAPRNLRVAARLHLLVAPLLDPAFEVLLQGGVHFDRRNLRVPDLLVCRRSAVDAGRVGPGDLLLAVEVVSPSSVSTDRVAKPAQYASAGIPVYWRIEPTTRTLVAHALEGDVYRETGRFDDVVEVTEPVPLRVRLTDLFD